MKVVLALGGSIIPVEEQEAIKSIGDLLKKCSRDVDIYVVAGGGKTARNYIKAARYFGAGEKFLDEIGIAATRLNAMLLKAFLCPEKAIPETIEKAAAMRPPLVMGGTTPGHSTDAVGAMLASAVKADRFIIATDVDGIYDSDPKKNKDAKKFDSISIKELRKMSPDTWDKAGKSSAIDGIACRIIDEGKISTYVVNGKDLKSLENAIYGREFRGTIIEV